MIRVELEKISRWVYLLVVITAIVMGLVVGYMAWSEGSWAA